MAKIFGSLVWKFWAVRKVFYWPPTPQVVVRMFWSLLDQFCTYRFVVRSFYRLLFAELRVLPQALLIA